IRPYGNPYAGAAVGKTKSLCHSLHGQYEEPRHGLVHVHER
ncbi:unnamed protein product, partial [marine sediment metagenome]